MTRRIFGHLIKDILDGRRLRCNGCGQCRGGARARADRKFDLILLDIWMPDTDGITLLREWSDAGELNCPVVIMSGHGTVDTAVEATRLGAFDFVEKPLSLAKLLRTVEAALESAGKQSSGRAACCRRCLRRLGAAHSCRVCASACSNTRDMMVRF